MATITFDVVAKRFDTVPLAVFDTLEEGEDFYTKWVPIMAERMSAGTVKGIRAIFSDWPVYRRVACADREKNGVVLYRNYLRTNLDYRAEIPRELIVHEVGHLLTPGCHSPQWKAMVSGWGIEPSRIINVREPDLSNINHYYMKCPCGAEWKRLKAPLTMEAGYTCGACGYDKLQWEFRKCRN